MPVQASRKLEAGCPRCGARIADPFKYCPNCAYRLRPDLAQASTPRPTRRGTRGQRLLATGGYLAFASLLLLVVLAGIRLFTEADVFLGVTQKTGVTRDRGVLAIQPESSFRKVTHGEAIWGLFMPPAGPATRGIVDDDFRLGIYEITNDQYYTFLLAWARKSGRRVPDSLYPTDWERLTGNLKVRKIYERHHGNHPVTSIRFSSALQFCAWMWEQTFKSDPDLIVDLPTADEYIRSARDDSAERNFPWEGGLVRGRANLDGELLPVNNPACGVYGGFYALVGNAAEWVHGTDSMRTPTAVGWSFGDGDAYRIWEDPQSARKSTPFSDGGVEPIWRGSPRPDVGFRIAVRSAPSVPRFVSVSAGPVQHRARAINESPALIRKGKSGLQGPVSFESGRDAVERRFEIAASETTNRQYLAFLIDEVARPESKAYPLPDSFTRLHPMADWSRFRDRFGDPYRDRYGDPRSAEHEDFQNLTLVSDTFPGPYGNPRKIPWIYEAGAENQPVRGIDVEQADAYAEWLNRKLGDGSHRFRLPTVAEFIRAGRRNGLSAFPWGGGQLDVRLICAGRRDDQNRPVSLAGRFAGSGEILGLVGNLPEFVRDTRQQRLLLAGGFYKLPAIYCTLDSFLDADWESVEIDLPAGSGESGPFLLDEYAGFRVVRVSQF